MSVGAIVAIVISAVLLTLLITFFAVLPKKVYFGAMFSKAYISAFSLIGMKFRKVDYIDVANAYIMAKKAKLGISLYDFEVISTSGGRPINVVQGITAAKLAKLNMSFEFAKALDISGYDIKLVVESYAKPKIIEVPLISAVAQDNIELNVKIVLTLKINFTNFLRGVSEDTISTRAMEAIIKKVANIEDSNELMQRPEILDKAVVDAEIEEGSKYDLVSVDITMLDVARDGNFEIEKQELEKHRITTANQLEQRRLVAVAMEQEMKVKEEEMKAKVAAGEVEVQKAIIKALEDGRIKDVLDFYKLQSIQSDIVARTNLSNKNDGQEEQ